MKKIILSVAYALLLMACSKNDDRIEGCNFLLDIGVNESINLSLPQYNQLNFVSSPVYALPHAGNGGIIITNTGGGFVAFDASDPNHAPSSCSVLTISGLDGICGCSDANTYNLFLGLPIENSELRCPLKAYRVEQSGNTLFISN